MFSKITKACFIEEAKKKKKFFKTHVKKWHTYIWRSILSGENHGVLTELTIAVVLFIS